MRQEEFTEDSPGQLVSIPGGWAYVPNALPPALVANWELSAALDRASRALARLDGKASEIQNKTIIMRPLVTREAIESNRIEGTHTQVTQVIVQQSGESAADASDAINNQEVINYLEATDLGARWIGEERPINSFMLRALHEVVLRGVRGERFSPGRLRTRQVWIGSPGDTPETATFVPPTPEHVQPAIDDLVQFITENEAYPALIAAGIAHYQFEAIHPFADGNGRLGRLMIPLHLMASQVITYPILAISPYLEDRRDEYLRLLKLVSTTGAWEQWLLFFLQAVYTQAEDALLRVSRTVQLHDLYRDSASKLRSKVPGAVVDLVMEQPIVTVSQVRDWARCDFKTARGALDALTRLGIVEMMPRSHPQRWIAQELIDAVYEV